MKSLIQCAALSTGLLFALAACSKSPVNESHTGTLAAGDETHPQDGSFYDEYTFKADAGWRIHITMNSTDVDSYLQLRRPGIPDETFLIEADDIAAGNLDAEIDIPAPVSGSYMVWANTSSSGDSGAYTLNISAQPAN